MTYQIKLASFEGPFDLLFHLIDKAEIDIYDIPVAKITDQYLSYITAMQSLDLEVASEFLVMAATLVQIKSRMLLPKPPKAELVEEEGLDPRDELVARLLEYRQYKAIADQLKTKEQKQGLTYIHPVDVDAYITAFAEQNPLKGLQLSDLLNALQAVLARVDLADPVTEIPREEVTVREKMREINRKLLLTTGGVSFTDLMRRARTRAMVVITFLALLELIRLGKVLVHQSENFAEMLIYRSTAEVAELETAELEVAD